MNYIQAQLAVYPITVYYDHSCVLCRSEILHIQARDDAKQLILVDCSSADFDDAAMPVPQAIMMDCIHAIDAQGQWLKATEVFVAMYGAVGMNTMAKAWAISKPLSEIIYPLIVRHRHTLSKLGVHHIFNAMTVRHLRKKAQLAFKNSQACKDNACGVKTKI